MDADIVTRASTATALFGLAAVFKVLRKWHIDWLKLKKPEKKRVLKGTTAKEAGENVGVGDAGPHWTDLVARIMILLLSLLGAVMLWLMTRLPTPLTTQTAAEIALFMAFLIVGSRELQEK